MTYGSISETGAKPGDKVRCVSVCEVEIEGIRYTPDREYTVVDWLGRPCVEGNSHGKKCGAGDQKWLLPFDGFGAKWAKV